MTPAQKWIRGLALLVSLCLANAEAVAAPPMPTGTSPGSISGPGPTQPSSTVTLSWGAVSGATYYGVGVTDMATGALVVDTWPTATSYTASLSASGQYRWNVAACNATGCSSYTARLYFQTPTSAGPGAISGVTPLPSPAQVNQSITFTISGTGTCGGLSLTFEDGASASLSGPFPLTTTHAYVSAGTFTATAIGITSCTGSASTPVTVNSINQPTITWSTPPPSSVISGQPFSVAWSISGGSPTHVNVHWDPMNPGGPGNPSGNINTSCQESSTSCSTNSPTSSPAPITAPTVTTSTVVRYLVHATVNGTDIFTDTRDVTVNPVPVTTGTLNVTTTPVNGDIFVDGEWRGNGSISIPLAAGSYTVSFGTVGGYTTPASQPAPITVGQPTSITGTYTPTGPTTGSLQVTVQRSDTNAALKGATVTLSGPSPYISTTEPDGTATFSDLLPGTYTATASLSGFQANNTQVTVSVNTPTSVTIPLTPTGPTTGTLNVTTTPVNGNIYVDGTLRGNGSISISLPAGSHTVSFGEVSGYATPSQRSVTISANETMVIAVAYDLIVLEKVNLLSPFNDATGVSITPPFGWSGVNGANRYWLMVATDPSHFPTDQNAKSCPTCVISGTTELTSHTLALAFPFGGRSGTLSVNTMYYWKVQAWNTNGAQGNYSDVFRFTTKAPESEPPKRVETQVGGTVAYTPARKAVIITHGWRDNASTWVKEMAVDFCFQLNPYPQFSGNPVEADYLTLICRANDWDVGVYDWRTDANSWQGSGLLVGEGLRLPPEALSYGKAHGEALGRTLFVRLRKGEDDSSPDRWEYGHIHFIAHSAGSGLIESATQLLKMRWNELKETVPTIGPAPAIHETFLDAYGPAEVESYGAWADWADNYVDTRWPGTDLFLSKAYSIDTTPPWGCGPICAHSQPYRFYGLSILNDGSFVGDADYKQSDPIYSTAVRGYPLSVENDETMASLRNRFPPSEQCKVIPVNGGTCISGSHPRTIVEYHGSVFNSALENSSNAVFSPPSSLQQGILYDRLDLGPGLVSNYAPKQMIAMRESATSGAATEPPSYLVVNVTTTTPVNTMRFNWSFAAAGEGLLRVFVGGNLVREIDQRYVTPSSPETEKVYIGGVDGPLPPGTYRITFRLDGFGTSASGVELTAVELGLLAEVSPTLTVAKTGSGTGTVTSTPAGIDCGADCSENYANGTLVSLTAIPNPGSIFVGWGGDCNSSGQVTLDAAKTCTATFTTTSNGPLIVSTTSPPAGEQGAAYGYALQAEGGTPPYTWSLGGGKKNKLPQGLTLTSDGILTGTPTKAKTATFTVQVTDATYALATKNLSLQIVKGVKIKTKKLKGGTVGTPYSSLLKTAGGIPPLSFSVVGGALPPGLTLDPATGEVSGTPTVAGPFDFVAQVTSSGGSTHQKNIRIKIK